MYKIKYKIVSSFEKKKHIDYNKYEYIINVYLYIIYIFFSLIIKL